MWKLLLQELSVQRSIRHEFFSMLILLDWLKAINRVFNNAHKSEKQGKTQCSVAIWCMGWWWQGCVLVSSRIIHAVISEPNCSSATSLS
jgi:hypothetical protein